MKSHERYADTGDALTDMATHFIVLRERGISPGNTIRKNSSMVSRLPAFIKKARNRKELLKTIEALQAK